MKAVILAGGAGTRISEETAVRPKPMVEIGPHPILWHIMKTYSVYGIDDFIICGGYKGHLIKEYFSSYFLRHASVTFNLRKNATVIHESAAEPWCVTVVDTGAETMTGGRLKRVRDFVGSETFCMTYGDGLSDLDFSELIAFHRMQGTLATLTAVQPPGRFGALKLEHNRMQVDTFREKPGGDGGWINGGFFVLEPGVFDYIEGDSTVWEQEPLDRLAKERQLSAYRHAGFWQNMDTLRDKNYLESLWQSGAPPWRVGW